MNNLIIKRSQLVRAKVTGTPTVGNKYYYTEVPNLSRNNIILYGFEVFSATQLSKTPQNETVIAAAGVPNVVLTWRDNKKQEFIYQMAAYTAVRSNNGGFIMLMKPRIINLTDSYIQLTNTASINSNEVLAVNMYYDIVGGQ
jgi:hypothetical protein